MRRVFQRNLNSDRYEAPRKSKRGPFVMRPCRDKRWKHCCKQIPG